MVDVATALATLVPEPSYFGSLTANTEEAYDAIEWNDERPKPTWAQIIDAAPAVSKSELKMFASKIRYERRTGGFTYYGDRFSTNHIAERAYTMNALAARDDKTYTVNWKLPDGQFVVLGRDDVIGLVASIAEFSSALYAVEATLAAGIDAGTITTEEQIVDALNEVPDEEPASYPVRSIRTSIGCGFIVDAQVIT